VEQVVIFAADDWFLERDFLGAGGLLMRSYRVFFSLVLQNGSFQKW
jgi:hypothetical protein